MKNTLYFILKAIFFLEIFKFLSRIFAYVEKRLDKKAYLIFKIYDATNWATNNYNTNIIQYLNQTMEFGQLIQYHMRYIFLEKSYTAFAGEARSRPFYKKSKLRIFLDQQFEML